MTRLKRNLDILRKAQYDEREHFKQKNKEKIRDIEQATRRAQRRVNRVVRRAIRGAEPPPLQIVNRNVGSDNPNRRPRTGRARKNQKRSRRGKKNQPKSRGGN